MPTRTLWLKVFPKTSFSTLGMLLSLLSFSAFNAFPQAETGQIVGTSPILRGHPFLAQR